MTSVYVLKLTHGKYYVGSTDRPLGQRILEHFSNCGSEFTRKYRPISVIRTILDCNQFEEDRTVKEYMSQYGIENVRGGSYVRMSLTQSQLDCLHLELRSASNLCFKCGASGHFVRECPSRHTNASRTRSMPKCERCGRSSHCVDKCFAKSHVDGSVICSSTDSSEADSEDDEPKWERAVKRQRVEREWHGASNCSAFGQISGYELTNISSCEEGSSSCSEDYD